MLTRREIARFVAGTSFVLTATPALAARPTRRAEAEALRRFAEQKHPRGIEAAQSRSWRDTWTKLVAEADTLSDSAYVVRARRALAWFEDGHTTVLPFEFTGAVPDPLRAGPFGKTMPLRARVFDDGMWVVRAKDEAAPLLGSKIVRIAGQPIEKLVAQMVGSWAAENPAWGHNWAWLSLSSAGLLHGLGAVSGAPDADIAVEAIDPTGKQASVNVHPRDGGNTDLAPLTRTPTRSETFAKETGRGNYVRSLNDRGTLYVSIDEIDDVEGYTFEKLSDDILAAMAPTTTKRVIVDLRRNGGGDNYKAETLRRELARSRFNAAGGLYVLTSPQTFSAAQNLANRLERETLATFVGEPTGSAPNLHGDPEFFTGEATGITAMVSTLRWYDGGPHDKRRWIFPDVFVPSRFADWLAGADPALDAAIAHAPLQPNGFKDRVRYFDRPSQAQAWKPFWR